MTPVSRYLLAAIAASSIFLSGCGAGFQAGPVTSPLGVMQGRVHGGQPPINGSHIYLYAAGTGAYAGPGIAAGTSNASVSLLGASTSGNPTTYSDGTNYYVKSDANGNFSIGGDYTCTAGQQVYAYAVSGDAGGGTNSGIGMLAVLGTCPAATNLAATVPFIWMNEVTTVAAAYAMAGFASDATHVSIGPTGSATTASSLATTGITNAFATAGNLANIANGTALSTTPSGNGTVPQAEINTLANILASCVNATDAAFANCTTLFGAAVGATNATTPTDTATAAINMAHAPVTGISTLYGLQAGVSAPFMPDLGTAPNDFTISLSFTGGGLGKSTYLSPHTLSVDASGNLWSTTYTIATTSAPIVPAVNTLAEFSPVGAPLSGTTGFTNAAENGVFTTAIDSSGNVWMANLNASNILEYSPTAATFTTYSTGLALSSPVDAEFDGNGNVWVANLGANTLTNFNSGTGALIKTTATTDISSPYGIAIEPTVDGGGVWVGNSSTSSAGKDATLYTSAGVFSVYKALTYHTQGGIAIDASGGAWYAEYEKYLVKGATSGTFGTTIQPGAAQYYLPELCSDYVDGAGNIWVTDYDDGTVYEVSNAGTVLSGSFGFIATGNSGYKAGVAPTVLAAEPNALVVDGSGNVWYTMGTDSTLRQIVGAATPVATPLSYAIANNLQGSKP